jgi:hypothetical protein
MFMIDGDRKRSIAYKRNSNFCSIRTSKIFAVSIALVTLFLPHCIIFIYFVLVQSNVTDDLRLQNKP